MFRQNNGSVIGDLPPDESGFKFHYVQMEHSKSNFQLFKKIRFKFHYVQMELNKALTIAPTD